MLTNLSSSENRVVGVPRRDVALKRQTIQPLFTHLMWEDWPFFGDITMRATEHSRTLAWLITSCLLISSLTTFSVSERASAQSDRDEHQTEKVSSDLRERVNSARSADERVRVILQIDGEASDELKALLRRDGVRIKRHHRSFGTRVVELPAGIVTELARYSEVSFVSPDREIKAHGHIETTTGAAVMRQEQGNGGFNGAGIGIAVIDSGVDNSHEALSGSSGTSRVVANVDFTGEGVLTNDPYGHGTHVASLAAGNSLVLSGAYTGIAPNANIINLRVLNSQGTGSTSALLSALDWVMTNRSAYNIRVVNMSLGAPAGDSYKNDPVCRAVRRLVDNGIVAVAAAGNNGKDSLGNKIYGGIHTPGNEPSAITVGASNTYGTDVRGDDSITTFSSRGPTRSYYTDLLGVKHYDNLIKPDLVAPGNKIVAAESKNNYLVTTYPQLDAAVSTLADGKMMYMSGTSMAAPIVAGAAALMLQANPNLTPNMVKAILMYTAQPLAGFNQFEQGAGQINVEGAVRMAQLIRTDLAATTAVGSPLLKSALPVPQTTIAGQTFTWSQGLILDHTYAAGADLFTKYQKIYGVSSLLSDGVLLSNGVLISNTAVLSDGVLLGSNILTSSGNTIGDGAVFCSTSVLLGDGTTLSGNTFLGDGTLISDGVLISNSVIAGDGVLISNKH